MAAELDEKLSAFRLRRLDQTAWAYLMLDARYEKVRVDGKVVSQAVLVTVGFTVEGKREVLDWRVADSESEQSWGEVFRSLKDRGLGCVKLVVSDAHSGIRSAISRHLQGVTWQRCRVHFKREMGRRVSYKKLKELNADLAAVFASEDKTECLLRAQAMANKWEKIAPAVARMLREGVEDCLAVLSLPEHHRRKFRSTNLLENIMKRLKKRTKVVGVFPNRASCDRLIGSQLLEPARETGRRRRRQLLQHGVCRGALCRSSPAPSHNSPYGLVMGLGGSKNDRSRRWSRIYRRYVALLCTRRIFGHLFVIPVSSFVIPWSCLRSLIPP